jgi:hypothetical protein
MRQGGRKSTEKCCAFDTVGLSGRRLQYIAAAALLIWAVACALIGIRAVLQLEKMETPVLELKLDDDELDDNWKLTPHVALSGDNELDDDWDSAPHGALPGRDVLDGKQNEALGHVLGASSIVSSIDSNSEIAGADLPAFKENFRDNQPHYQPSKLIDIHAPCGESLVPCIDEYVYFKVIVYQFNFALYA